MIYPFAAILAKEIFISFGALNLYFHTMVGYKQHFS